MKIFGYFIVVAIVGYAIYTILRNVVMDFLKGRNDKIKANYPLAYDEYVTANSQKLAACNEFMTLIKIVKRPITVWNKNEQRLIQRRNSLVDNASIIQKKYPLAYNHYITQHHISDSSQSIEELEDIIQRSIDLWSSEQQKLEEVERKQLEIKRQNEAKIAKAEAFNKWEREQEKFASLCYDISKDTMPNFGRYPYYVPFEKTDRKGEVVSGKYKIWQFFVSSYCLEDDLDYTDFEETKEETNKIIKFKNRERYFTSSVFDKIKKFVSKLSDTYAVSIYLCANNKDWSANSLHYHYAKGDFHSLPYNVEIYDPSSIALEKGAQLLYNNYPKLKNRHIIVIDMQTENSQLKEVCKQLIDNNTVNQPLITYISFLKGYDRTEMQELIDGEKRKKAAEEERKRKEREERMRKALEEIARKQQLEEDRRRKEEEEKKKAEDNRKRQIINLLHSNDIHCFYHFTAEANLSSIKRNGGLYSWWSLKQKGINIPTPGGDSTS